MFLEVTLSRSIITMVKAQSLLFLSILLLPLASCSGSEVEKITEALAKDPATTCIDETLGLAGSFQQHITVVRSNSALQGSASSSNGTCAVKQGTTLQMSTPFIPIPPTSN